MENTNACHENEVQMHITDHLDDHKERIKCILAI